MKVFIPPTAAPLIISVCPLSVDNPWTYISVPKMEAVALPERYDADIECSDQEAVIGYVLPDVGVNPPPDDTA
jgi:hypothetical protein